MAEGQHDKPLKDKLVDFLSESHWPWPVKTAASGIRHFGLPPVVAFLVGAAFVYGLAWFNGGLPGLAGAAVKSSVAVDTTDRITLSGEVKTIDNEPLPRFKVALRTHEFGPFDGGRFELPNVQRSESYDLIVWPDNGYTPLMMFGSRRAIEDSSRPNHLRLEHPLQNFPNRLARVSGKIVDRDRKPLVGTVDVAGHRTTIKADGTFEITDIALGETEIVVKDKDGKISKKPIRMELGAPTPFDHQHVPD